MQSSSPERSSEGPIDEESPRPPKKRRLMKKGDLLKSPVVHPADSSISKSAPKGSRNVIRGVRGRLPGTRVLCGPSPAKHADAAGPSLAIVQPTTSNVSPLPPLPTPQATTFADTNSATIIGDVLFNTHSALRPTTFTESQLRAQLEKITGEYMESVLRKFNRRIIDVEEVVDRANERSGQQERIVGNLQATLRETSNRLQEQDSRLHCFYTNSIFQDDKHIQREADVRRLQEMLQQQASELERLRTAKEQAECRAMEQELKVKQLESSLQDMNRSVLEFRSTIGPANRPDFIEGHVKSAVDAYMQKLNLVPVCISWDFLRCYAD